MSQTASLVNVSLCLRALDRATERRGHLPGMTVFYGPSGYGKSTAAAFVATARRAYYVEAKSVWTRKAMLEAILKEMGISKGQSVEPAKTIHGMLDQTAKELSDSKRPLIIDEMDHVVAKDGVEMIRDLYESSQGAILLIGEERLPGKLNRWERFAGRVLDWVPAQPADIEDAKQLRKLYCDRIEVADDLLARIVDVAKGSVRRICVNLERVQEVAQEIGARSMDVATWGDRALFTGQAPARRA